KFIDFKEFYKSLTEEQIEYLEEMLDILVEAANDFFDDWREWGEECDLLSFVSTVYDAKLISGTTGVISDSFIDLLKSDRGLFIKDRYSFIA
ncbi:hypothetical protein AB9F41_34300, partial [Rhizobium leguminosarum]|uniref:hypothetical protein n=1 Tax=Rhizobium leguminosarum TaxID=384 RepID=UPI003F9E048D